MLFRDIKIIDEDFEVQEHCFVRTEGAVITYIGRTAPEPLADERIYDGSARVLVPGFYNLHCHVPMTLLRGYGEGLPLQRWLNEKVFPFEAKLTPEDIVRGTRLGALEMMASGAVSISDMYFSINEMADALDECGMKANLCHGLSSFDPQQELSKLPGYQDTLRLSRQVKNGRYGGDAGSGDGSRIKADMGLHAEYTSTKGLVHQIAAAAKEEGMILHTHVSETRLEHEECKARHEGRTPLRYLYDCGILDGPMQAAHCVWLEPEDVKLMRETGATAVHNPSSNLKLGSGIAPVRDYLAQGMKLALGTDGASSNNNLNMMEEIHLAAMIARGSTLDANAVSAARILQMATRDGALAQGRTDCGAIAVGNRADLLVFDLDQAHMQPDYDTIANLVFSAQSGDIRMTMIDGRVVYEDGCYPHLDAEKIIREVRESFDRIRFSL